MKSRPGQHTGPSLFERSRSLLAPPPSRTGEKYRHELKYLISYADKAELAVRLAPVLHLDPHAQQGGYFIRSLYFDDYWNTAYEEKMPACCCARNTASAFITAATAALSWSERKIWQLHL